MKQVQPANYNRFEVFQKLATERVVGQAYSREGDSLITLKLYTMINEKFYVLICRGDSSKYLIMTREENRGSKKNKYVWHIVGNGKVDTANGVVQLDFDLFEKPIFMSLHPDKRPNLKVANDQEAS